MALGSPHGVLWKTSTFEFIQATKKVVVGTAESIDKATKEFSYSYSYVNVSNEYTLTIVRVE